MKKRFKLANRLPIWTKRFPLGVVILPTNWICHFEYLKSPDEARRPYRQKRTTKALRKRSNGNPISNLSENSRLAHKEACDE